MYSNEISSVQLTAWLAAALIPTAIQLTAGDSWLSVLLVATICLLCVFLRWRWGELPKGKIWAMLQWLLCVAVLATFSSKSIKSWPTGEHPVVAIILLSLALWSVLKGTSAAARVGCVLFWFILMLYLILLGAGLKEVRPPWLKPTKGDVDSLGCILLLTPATAVIHLNKREGCKPRLLLIGLLCTVAAAITAGVLSPKVTDMRNNPFYEMTRSLKLLGQARRFEAILSAGMTVGWFSLMSLYLSVCFVLGEQIRIGWGKPGVVIASVLASIFVLSELTAPVFLLLILTTVFWILIPLLTQGLEQIKKSKKSENSA